MKWFQVKVYYILIILIISGNFSFAGDQSEYYTGLKKGWTYIQQVYDRLNKQYVDDIDPYPLIRSGIDGMLEELDPYTVFLEEDGQRRLRIMTTGKYGGLGMEIGLRNKNITVIAPIDNTPAQRLGVQAGDIIDKIDGNSAKGFNVDEVSKLLRGKIGTDVTLTIRRPGLKEPMEMTMTRAEIIIKDIGFSGFISPGVGYINLTGFSDKAVSEVRTAINNMQKQEELQALILDVRGNPGGLLEAAVSVVNLFVKKDQLVVYTKGFREKQYDFYTKGEPILDQVPLVVMVDGGSASASEIVAGALQDLDRAVIVGEDTFGKGLVQKVFTLDKHKNVKLKMTTAKYYIPSGRCIQKKDYSKDNGVIRVDSSALSDADEAEFYTQNKRQVYDKGGIYPDIKVSSDSLSYVLMQLIRKSMIFDFAVDFHQKHPNWKNTNELDDSVMVQFDQFIKERGFAYECECAPDLEHIRKYATKKKYPEQIMALIDQLSDSLNAELIDEFEQEKTQISEFLHLELIEKYFGRSDRDRISLQKDKQAQKALQVLQDMREYKRILATH